MTCETYQHSQLSDGEFEIRLLRIDPASGPNDLLCIRLDTVRLQSRPKYLALSYTWGRPASHLPDDWDDPQRTKTIMVNRQPFEVRYNLFSALQTIRRTLSPNARWWIDAICINQNDVLERNKQVMTMKDIYASSQAAWVWLGPPDDATTMAFPKIASLSRSWDGRPINLRSLYIPDKHIQKCIKFVHSDFSGEYPLRPWHAMRWVALRSWFERAWVAQEISTAPRTIVQCGDQMIQFRDLENIRRVIIQLFLNLEKVIGFNVAGAKEALYDLCMSTNPLNNLMKIKYRYRTAELSMSHAMQWLRLKHVADLRDKAHAARGLAKVEGQTIPVDYSLAVEILYPGIARRSMLRSQSFEILSYCHFPPKILGLPSWTADWSDTGHKKWSALPQKESILSHLHCYREALYNATKHSAFYVRFDHNDREMLIRAAVLGQLGYVSSSDTGVFNNEGRSGLSGFNTLIAEELFQLDPKHSEICHQAKWLREWAAAQPIQELPNIGSSNWVFDPNIGFKTFKLLTYRPTQETLLEAYVQTVIAGSEMDRETGRIRRVRDIQRFIDPARGSIPPEAPSWLEGRAFAVSDLGYIALVPYQACVDDVIAVVQGSELPFILRPSQDKYLFIGQAYVHGIMDGEFWTSVEDGSVPLREIAII
ncbi:MAG: hypothetical protein Q9219_005388 [cf. Caloplaca sp. 3 TL-2023]